MDKDGYPEEHELQKIAQWDYKDFLGLMNYIEERWWAADMGYFRKSKKYFYLSTAGWSGNESIIEALEQNIMFWSCCWKSSHRGGHYQFEIPKALKGQGECYGQTVKTNRRTSYKQTES